MSNLSAGESIALKRRIEEIDLAGKRLDIVLVHLYPVISRHFAQALISEGFVYVNKEKALRKSTRLKYGDMIELLEYKKGCEEQPAPKKINLRILYNDDDIFAVDKPSGLTVHPGGGNYQDTLVNALLYYKERFNLSLSDIQGIDRAGIVHRLDKDTSGVMIIAKNNDSHRKLQHLFRERKVKKEYIALTYGEMKKDTYDVDIPVGRDKKNRLIFSPRSENPKEALTKIRVFTRFNGYSLIKAHPLTGRTHQIRVHLKELGHPVVGDIIYSQKKTGKILNLFAGDKTNPRLMLHSFKILFPHPYKNDIIIIKANVPSDFRKCFRILRTYNG